jgi:hypothetical protein
MNLVGSANAGIVRVDLDHRQERGERPLGRQDVAELLLDHVADHPLGLRAEDVERIRLDGLVCRPWSASSRPAARSRVR